MAASGKLFALALIGLSVALAAARPHSQAGLSPDDGEAHGRNLKIFKNKLASAGFATEVSPRWLRHPWMAVLRSDKGEQVCGGAVINYGTSRTSPGKLSGRILLTAAHCFKSGRTTTPWTILSLDAGAANPFYTPGINPLLNMEAYVNPYWNDFDGGAPDSSNPMGGQIAYSNPFQTPPTVHRTVYGTWPHPDYEFPRGSAKTLDNRAPKENDIALVLLDAQVGPPGGNTATNGPMPWITIPPRGASYSYAAHGNFGTPGETLRLVGMGATSKADPEVANATDRLRWADLRLNTLNECIRHAGAMPNLAQWGNNGRLCAGSVTPNATTGTGNLVPGLSACKGDSGGSLFRVNQNGQTNKWEGDGPVVGLVSYQEGFECGDQPVLFTDVAYHIDWILSTIATMETFNLYQMDMKLKCIDKRFSPSTATSFPDYTGSLDVPTQRKISGYLSTVIQKKKTGYSPFAVDFYSFKYDTVSRTSRLRYQWTTRKAKMETFNFFTTGVYSATPPVTATTGPFSLQAMPNTGLLGFLRKKKPTYFRNFADNIEELLLTGIDLYDNQVECSLQTVDLTFFNTTGAATNLEKSAAFVVPAA